MNQIEETRVGRSGYFTPERMAVSTLFFINGLIMGAWAPKIPEFASRLGLDPGALGIMILVMGVGSLTLMPLTGAQIARYGSTTVTRRPRFCSCRRFFFSASRRISGLAASPSSCSAG